MIFGLQLEQDSSLKKPQRLFFVLFGFLFLLAPFYYQPNLGGEGLYIPHNSTLWIVASWIIASASFLIYKNQEIILPKYWLGLALLPLGALFTGFVADNNNPTEWIIRITAIIGGYLFFLSLFQFRLKPKHVDRSLYIILAMGLIAATYGIIQTQTGAHNLSSFIPVSPRKIPVGIFQQVNLQSSMMATLLILAFYLAGRPALKSFGLIIQVTLVVAAIAASFSIASSGSRVGIIGAVIGLAAILIGRWRLMLNKKVLFSALMLAVIIGGTLGQSGLSRTAHKLDRAIGGVGADIRWHMYSLALDIFLEAPISGHGIGSFQKVFQEKRAEYHAKGETALDRAPRFTHPHNELIYWLVEGGIISIIGILAATVFTLIQLIKVGWQRGWGYAALLFPIILHTQVELPFYISNTHWFLLLFLLFLTHQTGKKLITTTNLSRAARRTLPICLLIAAIAFSTTLLHAQVANAGIINYLKRNQNAPTFLTPSLSSIYFREYTTYLLLRRQLIIGIQNNDIKPAENFILWAKESLKAVPAASTYRDLAIAYNTTKEIDNRNETLQKAIGTYPLNKGLKDLLIRFEERDNKEKEEIRNAELKSQARQQANQP